MVISIPALVSAGAWIDDVSAVVGTDGTAVVGPNGSSVVEMGEDDDVDIVMEAGLCSTGSARETFSPVIVISCSVAILASECLSKTPLYKAGASFAIPLRAKAAISFPYVTLQRTLVF
jgi:hypothetical protein